MDDLDRLFRRLVHNVRAGFPHLLSRQFQLSDIAQHVVPYRHNRRELGMETNQDYEHALLRLVSGERGYLTADLTVQEAARRELASADPDPDLLRTNGSALVSLVPAAVAATETDADGSTDGEPAAAAADSRPATPPAPAAPVPADAASERFVMGGATGSSSAGTPASPPLAWSERIRILTPEPAGQAGAGAPPQQQSAADAMSQSHPSSSGDSAATPQPATSASTGDSAASPRVSAPRPTASSPSAFHEPADGYVAPTGRSAATVVGGGSCRYCGSGLPEGRQVTFCPNCGQNVTIIQCPACSTELELGWKFCITCGRSADTTTDAPARTP